MIGAAGTADATPRRMPRRPTSKHPVKRKTAAKRAPAKRKTSAKRASAKRAAPKPAAEKTRTTRRHPPYEKRLERRGAVTVWLVDGAEVRKNIDIEFSNFGSHHTIEEIPAHEVWIDKETDPDEQRFFIAHALLERRLLNAGKDQDEVRKLANHEERRMRVAAGDLRKVMRGRAVPDVSKVKREIWKVLPNGAQVWFVKGRLVRSVYDIEFTEGGHEHVYEYIPRGEVWIDDDIHESERGYVVFHELHERNRMADGMDYDTAHAESSRLELHYRNHPDQLHEALAAEGWE